MPVSSYPIYHADGSPVYVSDLSIYSQYNNTAGYGVGIQLVGRDSPNYIEPIAQNFLQMTENFASSATPSDTTTLQGQLWFKKLSPTDGELYVRTTVTDITGGIANWKKIVTGDAVTSISVVTANGILGTVTNPTTTPVISLALGNITPTSVAATGTVSGSNLSGTNTGDQSLNSLLPTQTGNAGKVLSTDGANSLWIPNTGSGGTGSVTSVSGTGTVSGLTLSGTVTTSGSLTLGGTLTLTSGEITGALGFTPYNETNPAGYITPAGVSANVSGVVAIANGGTGQITANAGLNALLPPQAGNNGKLLFTNGSDTSWMPFTGTGTVSVVTGEDGVSVTDGTTTPVIGLGNIKPSSILTTGTIYGSNLTNTNTGDQTITLTGAVTGSGTGTFATTFNPTPTFTTVTTTNLNVQNVTFTGAGPVTISSGNDLVLDAVGFIKFSDVAQLVNKTKAQLNALAGVPVGAIAYCTDTVSGAKPVYYTGSAWLKIFDNVAI